MKDSNRRQQHRADPRLLDPDQMVWQNALTELVNHESKHIHALVLTDKIVRAVRDSSSTPLRIEDIWSATLLAWFRPIAAIGMLIVFLLAAYNIGRADPVPYQLSATERVLGMHPVTLATVYDLDLAAASE